MRYLSRRAAVLLMLLYSFAGCGGGGGSSAPSNVPAAAPTPTPAPTPVPAPVTRNGWTEEGVTADVTPASPSIGTAVTVQAEGFLVREQRFDGTTIFLWPSDENYVRQLVYDWEFDDGVRRLLRWPRGFTVSLDGDLATDPAVVAKTQEVVAEITGLTGLPITIGPGGEVTILINPAILDDGAIAQTSFGSRGATITDARVEFADRQEISGGAGSDYRNTLLHEMGHVMGMSHSASDRDVMTPAQGPGTKEGHYQPDEATCLHMMYVHRQPGNVQPDRDAALGTMTSAVRRFVVVD
jgi:hypothetical protein